MKRILFCVSVFFVLTSCSEEKIQEISAEDLDVQEEVASGDFSKKNGLLTSNFLPTFTNYYGRDRGTSTNRSSSIASEWIHEYDENEKLVKSYFFELYPYRILKEVTYLNSGEDNKLIYEIKQYSYYGLFYSITSNYELRIDEDFIIQSIGDAGTVFTEFNDEGWVTKINTVTSDGHIVYQTGYEYDEQGNILKYISYDTPGIITSTVDYTYNEIGDPLSYYFQNTAGAETKVKYYYRQNNTLEKLEEEYYIDNEDFGTEVYTYSEEERLLEEIEIKGDGSKRLTTYTDEEIVVEYFADNDLLIEVTIYQIQDESYFLKMRKQYVNGILNTIKYYDTNGELDYTEYYDEEGNLTETVYE